MAFRPGGQGVRSNWLALALGLAVVFFVVAVAGQFIGSRGGDPTGTGVPGQETPTPPPNAVAISIASSNTKEAWLHQAVDAFNAAAASDTALQIGGKPVYVTVLQEVVDGKNVDYRSGTMVSDTLGGRIEPTVLSPGDVSWLSKLEHEWSSQKGGDPIGAADSPDRRPHARRRRDVAVACRRPRLLAHRGPGLHLVPPPRPRGGDRRLGIGRSPRMASLQVRLRLLR